MNNNNNAQRTSASSLGLGTIGLITFIVFISLKCSGTWASLPWFWVWFPLWAPWALSLLLFAILVVVYLIAGVMDKVEKNKPYGVFVRYKFKEHKRFKTKERAIKYAKRQEGRTEVVQFLTDCASTSDFQSVASFMDGKEI